MFVWELRLWSKGEDREGEKEKKKGNKERNKKKSSVWMISTPIVFSDLFYLRQKQKKKKKRKINQNQNTKKNWTPPKKIRTNKTTTTNQSINKTNNTKERNQRGKTKQTLLTDLPFLKRDIKIVISGTLTQACDVVLPDWLACGGVMTWRAVIGWWWGGAGRTRGYDWLPRWV